MEGSSDRPSGPDTETEVEPTPARRRKRMRPADRAAILRTTEPDVQPATRFPVPHGWVDALGRFRDGDPVGALESLRDARRARFLFVEEAEAVRIIDAVEEAALGLVAEVIRGGDRGQALTLVERLEKLLQDEDRLKALEVLKGRIDVGAAEAKVLLDATDPKDRAALARHLDRFGHATPYGKRSGKPVAAWVDRQLASLRKRRAKPPAPKPEVFLFPVADPDHAEVRRLEQLDKLRQRKAVGLLDHIQGGLAWLALHQGPDGGFDGKSTEAQCKALGHKPACDPRGKYTDPVATTGLVVLAFLDFRDQDAREIFEPTLTLAIDWLVKRQKKDGSFPRERGYGEAVALMALGQAAASSDREDLRQSLERAWEYYAAVAGPEGGYRYAPRQPGDLSATGWFAQGYEAAVAAGVELPEGLRLGLDRFSRSVWNGATGFAYMPRRNPTARLMAVGMLTRMIVRDESAEPLPDTWSQALVAAKPGKPNLYRLYYEVRVQLALDGDLSPGRRKQVFALASKSQVTKGHAAGTFDLDKDPYLGRHGRTLATAFAVLTLEHALYRR